MSRSSRAQRTIDGTKATLGGAWHDLRMGGEKPKDARRTLARLLVYLRPHRFVLVSVIVLTCLANICTILAPKVMGQATTELFKPLSGGTIEMGSVYHVLWILMILYIGTAIFSYLEQYVMARLAQQVVIDLRAQVDAKLNVLPLSYFDRHRQGEVLSRVSNDIDLVASSLQDTFTQAISVVVTFVGIFAVMVTINLWMTLILVVTVPLSLLATLLVSKESLKEFGAQQASLANLNGHIEEMLGAHEVVRAFGLEDEALGRFDERNDAYYRHASRARFVSSVIVPLIAFIGNLGFVASCIVGGVLVSQGAIGVGDIQTTILYLSSFPDPITHIAALFGILQSTVAAAERVFEMLDEPEVADEQGEPHALDHLEGRIDFDHVRFGYEHERDVVHDLCCAVPAGSMTAIVGPTGAGKTTLVNLLLRFYETRGGMISIDGHSIRDVAATDLRSHLGLVMQEPWLFSGTVRENIAFGANEEVSREEVVDAACAAHADHFIRVFPDGYDTVINEEGSNVSAGERQLITIARALIANPEVLVLDEATSSIDSRTERLVQQTMREMMTGRTSFVIAHRLSTVRDADRILVMRNGDIVEQGTHEQLMAAQGFYAELYRSQFSG